VFGKVFERVLLHCLTDLQSQLNPLQGGIKSGHSCLHYYFARGNSLSRGAEVIRCFFRCTKSIWHSMACGVDVMSSLHLDNWYRNSTSAVLQELLHLPLLLTFSKWYDRVPFSPLCCTHYLLIPSWTNWHLQAMVSLLASYTVSPHVCRRCCPY